MIRPFVYRPDVDRWRVDVEFKPGEMTNVKITKDRRKAEQTCNFWDETLPTHITHIPAKRPRNTLELAMDKFDQLERWVTNA